MYSIAHLDMMLWCVLHRKRNEEGVGIERVKRSQENDPSRCYYSRYITSLLPPQLFDDGSAVFWMYALHIMYPALNFNYPARKKFETVVAGAVEVIEHLPRV